MKGTLHHIELYVEDLAKTTLFWEWLLSQLGYTRYQVWDKGISFRLNETYLVFVQVEEHQKAFGYHRQRIGLNHLAFDGGSKADVDSLTKVLIQRGIPILYQDRHPYAGGKDYYAVYCEDPNRIKVEVVGK